MAYELIETYEVGSGGAASIEFTSIPQDGVDLLLLTSIRSNRTNSDLDNQYIIVNGSSPNPTTIALRGSGSAVASFSVSGYDTAAIVGASSTDSQTSNTFGNGSIYISNYTSASSHSFSSDSVSENNAATAYQYILAMTDGLSAAITSLELAPVSGTLFNQYSTASLYKIY